MRGNATRLVASAAVALLLATACSTAPGDGAAEPADAVPSGPAGAERDPALASIALPVASDAEYGGAVVADWVELLTDLVRREVLSPPVASRLYAYTALALHEGVAAAGAVPSLAPELEGLLLPPPSEDLDPVVTAVASVSHLTLALLPGIESSRAAESLASQHIDKQGADAEVTERSLRAGREIADAIVAWSEEDGYEEAGSRPYTPPTGDGLWVPTLPAYARALEPYWGELRPFMALADDCSLPAPPIYDADPESEFYAEAMAVVQAKPGPEDEERLIARYWNDRPGATSTPPGHWLDITAAQIREREVGLAEAARVHALMGISVADAFIANWKVKYEHNVVRPITYIRDHIDATWFPAIQTPPFPDYPSGHSTVSGAASAILSESFGDAPFVDATHVRQGFEPREFASFAEAAEEAAASRLYGGIHYPFSIDAALDQGRCIAAAVLERAGTVSEDGTDRLPRISTGA